MTVPQKSQWNQTYYGAYFYQPGGGWISGGLGIASSVSCEALLGGSGACPLEKFPQIDINMCIFVPFGGDLDWKYHSESRIFTILGDFCEILGIIRELGGGWDLLKCSGDSPSLWRVFGAAVQRFHSTCPELVYAAFNGYLCDITAAANPNGRWNWVSLTQFLISV